jgi:hypothetical protein
MRIIIQISKRVSDWDGFVEELEQIEKSAKAEGYDEESQIVTLEVDRKSIDDYYHPVGGRYPIECEGRTEWVEEVGVCVHSCKWLGHDIINAEQVCSELEGFTYVE